VQGKPTPREDYEKVSRIVTREAWGRVHVVHYRGSWKRTVVRRKNTRKKEDARPTP